MVHLPRVTLTAVGLIGAMALIEMPGNAKDKVAGNLLPAERAALEKYLPNSTEGVIIFRVQQFCNSAFLKKADKKGDLCKMLSSNQAAVKIMKELNFDPLKDITQIISSLGPNGKDPLFLLQGNYDVAKFRQKAASLQLKTHQAAGGQIYELSKLDELIPLPADVAGMLDLQNQPLFLTVIDKNYLAIATDKAILVEVLAKAKGTKKTVLQNKDLDGLLSKINPRQCLSVVIVGATAATSSEEVRSITGGLLVTDDIKAEFILAAKDADAAKEVNKQLHSRIEDVKPLLEILTDAQPELAPLVQILNGIKYQVEGKGVAIRSTITAATVEKTLQGLAALAKQIPQIKKP